MGKKVELPLVKPVYSTYHNGIFSACITENQTIRNFYLNEVMILTCNKKFLFGYTTPEIGVDNTSLENTPYLTQRWVFMEFLKGYIHPVIRNMIDEGYYVYFYGIDDYYVKGKSWYKEKHFNHDGAICGYNQEDKTYCIYAYDSNWVYRKFWTPQKCFESGRRAMFREGKYGFICGLKPTMDKVEFSVEKALKKIEEYLDSDMKKYPESEDGEVRGIVVHEYIAKYVRKLHNGSIPYERMDRRIFRLIWEHKKIMLERIQRIEETLGINSDISTRYESLVNLANSMRTMYALHHMKRRDSVLPIIERKLLELKENEYGLLRELLDNSKIVFKRREIYGY